MKTNLSISVLCGGIGLEREISLVSGEAVFNALREQFPARLVELNEAELPPGLNPERDLIFPALHGEFGEDGRIQALLQDRGIHYAGSDARASRLCIHKEDTKAVVREVGVPVAPGRYFQSESQPDLKEIEQELGTDLILKPNNLGSSVHLLTIETPSALARAMADLPAGEWLLEKRIRGREVSVGILEGRALGIVELKPAGGIYDYRAKYTAGETEYEFPARVSEALAEEIRLLAERAFQVCGCRDFARVDFMVSSDNRPCFIEINTLPGLTPTSLLPKSASCYGYTFEQLAAELVKPALARHATAYPLRKL